VDLPGYGYAHASQRDRREFNQAVSDYLEGRRNIFCVFVLIDSRLAPQRIDLDFIRWLIGCSAPFALVFTKADKQTADGLRRQIELFKKSLAEWCEHLPKIFACSAKTRAGRPEILECIEQVLAENNRV
jgi:GTP-binding protein